jgi:SAM-dependent methyltransferase
MSLDCPLCGQTNTQLYYTDVFRHWPYWQCQDCSFMFRDPSTLLDPSAEKARYLTHNNSIESEGYVSFLAPVVETLLPHLAPNTLGLDYGAGPGPILDQLFAPHHIHMHNYDPFFAPQEPVGPYDFITCTEVFEHFYQPAKEMEKITGLLKPGGHLLIMTQPYPAPTEMERWSYRYDNTHVGFVNRKSLDWVATKWNYRWISHQPRIFIFQKQK